MIAKPVWMRKLDKLVEQNPEQFKPGRAEICKGQVVAKRYLFPKRFITIRSKDIKRELTDEQITLKSILRSKFPQQIGKRN